MSELNEKVVLDFLTKDVDNADDAVSDPLTATRINVTLDNLQPYDLNPRQSENPKYAEIRDSIESVGLKFPFRITRRHPEDVKYSIRDGGNTRLAILNELHQKYRQLAEQPDISEDEKLVLLAKADSFFLVPCDFVPFVDDLDALSNHMIENEARCGTKFIERALVVAQYRKLFAEQGLDNLSSRQLAKRITDHGWRIGADHITRYDYATKSLLDYIPIALWAGAGFSVVRKLRALYTACRHFWVATDYGQEHADEIDDLFYNTLAMFDDDQIDVQGFNVALCDALEPVLHIASMTINAEIMSMLSNPKHTVIVTAPPSVPDVTSNSDNVSDSSGVGTANSHANGVNPNSNRRIPAQPVISTPPRSELNQDQNIGNQVNHPGSQHRVSTDHNQGANPQSPASPTIAATSNYTDIEDLPDSIPELQAMIIEQVKKIDGMTPGYLGITIREDDLDNPKRILYDVVGFKNSEPPIYGDDGINDERVMVWYQLHKYSRAYQNSPASFTTDFSVILADYLRAVQEISPRRDLIDIIMWLEHRLMQYPGLYRECTKLQRLQVRLLGVLGMHRDYWFIENENNGEQS